MFQIPGHLLDKLKCSICDGYLNSRPVVVKNESQICGKCYKILPQNEKEMCSKQISFETLGNCLIFPCRYHEMGCEYTFTWNNENGHESECKKRYFTFPDLIAIDKKCTESFSSDISLKSSAVSLEDSRITAFSRNQPKNSSDSALTTQQSSGRANLAFNSDFTDDDQNRVNLHLEGKVVFQNSSYPELRHNRSNAKPLYENIYDTVISSSTSVDFQTTYQCLNCHTTVEKGKKYKCLFGHVSCNNCKSEMCVACVKNLNGTLKTACRNVSKGCKEVLLQGDVAFHRDNCDFNEIPCPVEGCHEKQVFEKLKEHLQNVHQDKIICSNELTKPMYSKDKVLIFLCFDGIFKCSYFYYGLSIEIFVVYLGPCTQASDFLFELSVEANKKVVKKTQECANWNNCMLASGINFDKKELVNSGERKFNFQLNLKIMRGK